MIKQITLSNFIIKSKEKPGSLPDHTLLIYFMPKTAGDFEFSKVPIDIKIQYMNGIMDYSINDKDFDCTLFYEDNVSSNMRDVSKHFAYFTPKMKKDGGNDSDTVEPAKPAQLIDNSNVKTNYKSIRSFPGAKSRVLISDDAIALRSAGDGEEGSLVTISPSQISVFGKIVEYDFPTRSNVVLKESGMMSMLPKAFVPPFCMPDHLPDVTMVVRASEALNIVKKLKDLF